MSQLKHVGTVEVILSKKGRKFYFSLKLELEGVIEEYECQTAFATEDEARKEGQRLVQVLSMRMNSPTIPFDLLTQFYSQEAPKDALMN